MPKTWILKSENEIDPDLNYKKNKVCDKHIEIKHTHGFMSFIWLIGGLACIVLLNALGGYLGLIVGFSGMLLIQLIEKAFTKKTTKDLHLICYAERDEKHDDYFAIDLKTNEILYVQNIFADPNDKNPATVYDFAPVSLDVFKKHIENSSKQYYKLVRDITPSTKSLLKEIQFGETEWKWIWFTKQKEGEKINIGCFRIGKTDATYAKYVELSEEDYSKYFGGYTQLNKLYKAFMDDNSPIFKDESIKCFSKQLLDEEFQTFLTIFNGDTRKCETFIEKYFSRKFITEYEYEGSARLPDAIGMDFLKHLSDNKEGSVFTPTTFSDDEIIKESTTENETKNTPSAPIINQQCDKYKNYGLASLICSLCSLTCVPILPSIAGLILGIASIKHSNKLGIKRDGKAIAGVIISSIQLFFIVVIILSAI